MNHGDPVQSAPDGARRSFLVRLSASLMGGVVALFPFVAGWGVFSDPLRRSRRAAGDDESADGDFVRICPLDALPADGVPRAFPVATDAVDAWTRTPALRIGEVFLSRTDVGDKPNVTAFTAACPHLGCAVEFEAAEGQFECPCHASAFGKDGRKLFGPSLRGLDPLDVKLVGDDEGREIWVAFQRFRAGVAERTPIA